MHRIVLDTNVLVSALLNPHGAPAEISEGLLEGRWALLAAPDIFSEYEGVLSRAKFGLPTGVVKETFRRLRRAAILIRPWESIQACVDPADDKFLACALCGKAKHLVTGNIRHFPKGSFMGIRILAPADFLRGYFYS
ncbi:MAG: putative toxin-antitoxin system toxin component, PIN family [Elusimicrobiota bacterium]